jgi:redox-sensitive bicupin YhaK (pirin superfamily)
MINTVPFNSLGHANHGWLNARHHFSFAQYYNPKRMNFGVLRVINDDIIKAGSGFGLHPHQDMEIITFVRRGAITHRDNQGNEGRTEAGDVQVMSAGTGIYHSEYNLESEDTQLYQIWIEPNKRRVKPRWDSHEFPKTETDGLQLLVSGDDQAPLQIHQDAYVYAGRLKTGTKLTQKLKHQGYLLVSSGSVQVGDLLLEQGDGAEITHEKQVELMAHSDAQVLLLDVPNENYAATS